MSLSTDPDYLATHGIRAVGGPLNDQIIDDGALLLRTIGYHGGFYHLKGSADGGLEYVWGDLAPLHPRPTQGSTSND